MQIPRSHPPTTRAHEHPAHGEHLSREECWSHLRRHHQGRLGYESGRGPRHVVLPYAVWDDRVVVRVPAYSEAAQHAADRVVTFDVVEPLAPGTAGRVEVHGHARLSAPEGAVLGALPDEHWPADLPSRLVWLQVEDLHGEAEPVGHPGVPATC
ncbi:hypothetical protein [Microlunatus flavus]|uniref:Pyridoxamine 5'-phosphate oxidase n=1 Tax=Microlunatus flavus TaxID=1036181 RepID=A0A1H9J4J1_9ACTN|nr:hypothetical protein [Microlunatus flavus]SEQ81790.1 hypothetical protein SAMN05421756_10690 [Microlunatus flavus]